MAGRIYGSSIYNKVLYGILSAGILLPGLWAMFYGLQKGGYNIIIFIISALLCSYTLYIYQRMFSYKVIILDNHMEIWDFNKKVLIKYSDIVDIKVKHNASYIIDRVSVGGRYCIVSTPRVCEGSGDPDICIDCRKLPVLQKAYIGSYDELMMDIISRCSFEGYLETASAVQEKSAFKSSFISVSLLREVDEIQAGLCDSLNVLIPYLMLLLVLLMALVEYGVWRKGIMPQWLIPYSRLAFPLFTVITLYIIVIKHTPHLKGLMDKESVKINMPRWHIAAYVISNIILSAGVITLFFLMLNNSYI